MPHADAVGTLLNLQHLNELQYFNILRHAVSVYFCIFGDPVAPFRPLVPVCQMDVSNSKQRRVKHQYACMVIKKRFTDLHGHSTTCACASVNRSRTQTFRSTSDAYRLLFETLI